MDHDAFVSVIPFFKKKEGKTETENYALGIFLCSLTAAMQPFLRHRFLTEKIQGLLFFQSSPIDIADSCNTLLSGYWTFWSSGPEFILGTADFTKKPFHDMGETENSVMLQHHVFYSSYFCFISSVVKQKHSTSIYRWCLFQHISFFVSLI